MIYLLVIYIKKRAELVCEICSLTLHKLVAIRVISYSIKRFGRQNLTMHLLTPESSNCLL